jgi:hypothetical protein
MMIGNFFTKPLQGKKFEFFRDLILGKESAGKRFLPSDEGHTKV